MRKTKIICTLGPATDQPDVLKDLMLAGMNVARFNFSHSDYAEHARRFHEVEKLREELNLPIATMLDTRGPEIRLGTFENGEPVEVENGDPYILTTKEVKGNHQMCSVSYKGLPFDVSIGTKILINDGMVAMQVEKIEQTELYCKVTDGGMLSDRKGVNLPGIALSMPYLSDQDMSDLEVGAKLGFDFIAASFVRSAADVAYLRKFTKALGWGDVRIIAKIENMDGVRNLDEILQEADGVMVARGDLGVEVPFEDIPALQKDIIKRAYRAGKQVITATQMLESMIYNSVPTRAEVTDVANAIYDGTSAIMLSGETAAGAHPVESVQTMVRIAKRTEGDIDYVRRFKMANFVNDKCITNAISHATVTTAHDLEAKAIITVTKSGSTARMISKHRPQCQIIACTTSEKVRRQMNLSWGIMPLLCKEEENTDALFAHAVAVSKAAGLVESGDIAVITAGIPLGISGTTNMLKVEKLS